MKLPKIRKTYCKYCKKHTEHEVIESKKKTPFTAHPQAYGSKIRARRRGRMGAGNLGRYSKPALSKWKMTGKKSSKKADIRYKCKVCKKAHTQKQGIRIKKVEFK